MLNLILFGPPGSGKGTQAANLIEKYGLLHISTGDLFRSEIGKKTPLGIKAQEFMSRGELVPDEITIGMLQNKVNANPDVSGIIFDGFPRTISQARALDDFLSERGTAVTILVALDVPDDELVKRILLRGKTSGRNDDNDESIIRNRIKVYEEETAPIFDYYSEYGKSRKVGGVGSVDSIFENIASHIDALC
ncbi:MAG: adenylate kinase [Saprospiraceae bacterium]|jgi:adenylate kinase|nr:adenylate kinase [Saprospiraceae bacterium]